MVIGQNLAKHGVCFCLAHEREQQVSNAQNLVQLLRLSHFDINDISDQAEICTYVMRNLKRVCIVLDGLDEVKLQNCSPYVRSIIQGQALRDVN